MVKKKIDSRIRILIENGVKGGHRSMFLMIGDKGKEQIVNLHYFLSKVQIKNKLNVLWCYKKDLGFSSHRKKRIKQIKKEISKGLRKIDENDPFELFITHTNIRYCYYKDTHQILGKTFGMLILSDFYALVPNILARTIETLNGGGVIVILIKTMNSLKQLYYLTMDCHKRYRTEVHRDIVGRFNERFLLSLTNCENFLCIDDEFNVLPLSSKIKKLKPSQNIRKNHEQQMLKDLQQELKDTEIIGNLLRCVITLDQAKAILTFIESIVDKNIKSLVSLTAGRGRGKSAALGISMAASIAYGYSNIFCTAPSPENLGTMFNILLKGLISLGFKEYTHYIAIHSMNPNFNKAMIRINIFREHKQTVQYIRPQDNQYLAQAEILVIDEAAAIPLPIVKKLFGPYVIFISSTINGYEGTGRSLSLKLLKQLKKQCLKNVKKNILQKETSFNNGFLLREFTLHEPIRYSSGDPIELWLTKLLCLDCTGKKHHISNGFPAPETCELYYINRDTLFSYNPVSERFLQRLMSLYVSSHYKNSPNDLQLISDAPAHHLFVLLGPRKDDTQLPDLLTVIQICQEGSISRKTVEDHILRRNRYNPSGDLIPWTISQQFQDVNFGCLSGIRVVRIATHPDCQRMKYGTQAMKLLFQYYEGKIECMNSVSINKQNKHIINDISNNILQKEILSPKSNLAPILIPLNKRKPELFHYIGVSYGLTLDLFRFWKGLKFEIIYIRQTSNNLTGEHTCIMMKSLCKTDFIKNQWLSIYRKDFKQRFMILSSMTFRTFNLKLSLVVLDPLPNICSSREQNQKIFTFKELNSLFTSFDLKRLIAYTKKRVDFHVILDLVPKLAKLFFNNKFKFSMSFTQCAILNAFGLQKKKIEEINMDFGMPVDQILALFKKIIIKFVTCFVRIEERKERKEIPKQYFFRKKNVNYNFLTKFEENKHKKKQKKQKKLLSLLKLNEYQIIGENKEWSEVLKTKKGGIVSISKINRKEK